MVNIFVSTSNHLIWLDLLKLFLSSILLTLIFILSACVFYVCVFPLSSIFFLFLLLCLFCFLIHSKPVCACMRACICIWVDAISKIPWMSLNMNVWQLHWRKKKPWTVDLAFFFFEFYKLKHVVASRLTCRLFHFAQNQSLSEEQQRILDSIIGFYYRYLVIINITYIKFTVEWFDSQFQWSRLLIFSECKMLSAWFTTNCLIKNDVSASILWNFEQCPPITIISNDVQKREWLVPQCVAEMVVLSILGKKNEWILKKKRKGNLMVVWPVFSECSLHIHILNGSSLKRRKRVIENGEFICCAPSSLLVCDAMLVNVLCVCVCVFRKIMNNFLNRPHAKIITHIFLTLTRSSFPFNSIITSLMHTGCVCVRSVINEIFFCLLSIFTIGKCCASRHKTFQFRFSSRQFIQVFQAECFFLSFSLFAKRRTKPICQLGCCFLVFADALACKLTN